MQTHERFKRTLFVRTKHNMRILWPRGLFSGQMLVWFGSLLKAGKPVVAYRTISEYSHPGPCHPRSKVRPEGLSYCLSLDLNMLTPKWDTMTVHLHHLPLGLPCFSPALLPGLSCSGMYIAGNITLSLIWVCLVLALLSYLSLAAVACV